MGVAFQTFNTWFGMTAAMSIATICCSLAIMNHLVSFGYLTLFVKNCAGVIAQHQRLKRIQDVKRGVMQHIPDQ